MKRIVLAALALALLLFACGRAEPEQPTTEVTTEATVTTIEETTTEPFVPTEGEANEITWRVLDVNAAEGREAVQWLAQRYEQRMESMERNRD